MTLPLAHVKAPIMPSTVENLPVYVQVWDLFAAAALQAVLSNSDSMNEINEALCEYKPLATYGDRLKDLQAALSRYSAEMADAMLSEREKRFPVKEVA